jgi:tRNA uridine 5-carboxymethylaminomethyl modification enzyme
VYTYPKHYDVIVIGAGHAGVEAALATARMGCTTLLLSMNLDTVGQMSCNPAIGGLAKGHLVREIDALGGEMGRTADMTGLQFRMLNTRKGPSVWAPRAQCDKKAYQFRLKWVCERQADLDLKQALATGLVVEDDTVQGVTTSLDIVYRSGAVVLTTGTFLRGLLHIGDNRQDGGRAGEQAATGMSACLMQLGFELGRMKTGTPPRLLKSSIDFSKTELQPGDEPVPYFTFWKEDLFHVEQPLSVPEQAYPPGSLLEQLGGQLPCHLTSTTPATAELIRSNLDRSPLYAGSIEGTGPRYCPSIEDKVVRFSDKETHQIFLEPEGASTEEVYANGFSTSLPYDVQVQMVRTIRGCEHAEIMRPAYAVEYDFAEPTQLHASLETKRIRNLFFAGQINGTSGYEEAAAQGLMAGINAVRRLQEMEALVLTRDQAYIGVLIDDLVTKGTVEPYRMFTSRAEYRLLLRQDNADLRLSEIGHQAGLLSEKRYSRFQQKRSVFESEMARIAQTRHQAQSLEQVLRRPEVRYRDLPGADVRLPEEVVQQIEFAAKYAGYVERQNAEVDRLKSLEEKRIPHDMDYQSLRGLRTEAQLKLMQIRPRTVGQASRISGITPADIALVCVWLRRGECC